MIYVIITGILILVIFGGFCAKVLYGIQDGLDKQYNEKEDIIDE